jgi:hypothetical protein
MVELRRFELLSAGSILSHSHAFLVSIFFTDEVTKTFTNPYPLYGVDRNLTFCLAQVLSARLFPPTIGPVGGVFDSLVA